MSEEMIQWAKQEGRIKVSGAKRGEVECISMYILQRQWSELSRGYNSRIKGIVRNVFEKVKMWPPDGMHIASASNDQTVQVWQA